MAALKEKIFIHLLHVNAVPVFKLHQYQHFRVFSVARMYGFDTTGVRF